MGLLDSYFDPSMFSGQGGLLNRLLPSIGTLPQSAGFPDQPAFSPSGRTFDAATFDPQTYAPNQAQPISVGSYQMPRVGSADLFQPQQASLPANATPTQGQMQPGQSAPMQAAPTPAAPMQIPNNPGGLSAGISGFINNLHTGPIGALIGGIGSAAGLQDQKTINAAQRANATAEYLRKAGIPEEAITAAVGNGRVPGDPEVLKTILSGLKEKVKVHPATAAEKAAAGVPADMPLFLDENGKPTFAPAGTNVNVSTEKTGQAELATKGVQAYVDAQAAGRDAQKRVAMYDAFEKAAQGFTPGATAEMRLAAKRYLKDAGLIKGEDVPDGEIMQMISRQLGVHAQPKGQGAVSNYERELFAKSLPNMTQSPEGLKQAIDISRRLEQFDQKVAEIYRESARTNKGLPNYLEVQDKIAALGSPLSDSQMAAIKSGSPVSAPKASSPPIPQPGMIKDGWRFKGGDPSKKENWEQAS
jgi:hypothetical protein